MRTRTKEVETTDISRTPDYLQKLVSHIRLVRMKWIDNSRYFPMMLLMPVLIFFSSLEYYPTALDVRDEFL